MLNTGFIAYQIGYRNGQATGPAVAASPAAPASPQGTTRLTLTPATLQLGKLHQNQKLESKVVYKNEGQQTLAITQVDTNCGCTIPDLPKKVLAPGESGEMTVKFDAGMIPGPFEKLVTISYNGEPPQLELKLVGEVEPVVAVMPGIVKLGVGQSKTFQMIGTTLDTRFKIEKIETGVEGLEVKVTRKIGDNAYELTASVTKPLPKLEQTNAFKIEIYTDLAEMGPFPFFVMPQ